MADKQQPTGELTLIAANTLFEGKIKTEGSIRIDGKLSARNITIAGRISGTVNATEKLVLESKSIMQGDIRAARLVVDEGATFDGRCDMKQAGAPAPGVPKKE